ncbi:protein YvfG [Pseudalkalibacillus salsuginis]|uniref:protein YvfG n=1 Tax=Pseudalkalibacillus salsuginis TaxID=2910972 RepID=UPI001F2C264B|nr:protein YvfG [Pseudalkalibacillus salsuginis]MCF6408385.1 protein YvfG [Pseudalkalibacillus salsuginis]
MEQFSVAFFEENFKTFVEQNEDVFSKQQAMNSYYVSMVSTIINDNINKNSELVKRIRNLNTAYQNYRS